jgi:hypothetical protein
MSFKTFSNLMLIRIIILFILCNSVKNCGASYWYLFYFDGLCYDCSNVQTNCNSCSFDSPNAFLCYQCKSNNLSVLINNTCFNCSEIMLNCKTCSNSNNCLSCLIGFAFNNSNACIICSSVMSNCNICNNLTVCI